MIQALITKEIIGMLAPAEEIPEYEQTYIKTIPDVDVRTLMEEQNQEVYSNDLGSMIPEHEQYGEEDDDETESEKEVEGPSTMLGGAGTPIVDTGISYYPQQAIAVQLNGLNTGR